MDRAGIERARQKAEAVRASVQRQRQDLVEQRRVRQQGATEDADLPAPSELSPDATSAWIRERLLKGQREAKMGIEVRPKSSSPGERDGQGEGQLHGDGQHTLQPLVQNSSLRTSSTRGSILELRGEGMISAAASNELYHLMRRKYNYARPDDDDLSKQTFITSLFYDLQWVMRELGCDVDHDEAESWALLVHETLTRQSRRYHSVAHVYEVSAGASPLQLLATMFRNLVRPSVDGGLTSCQKELMEGVLVDGTCILSPSLSNVRIELVASIFGYEPGDNLQRFDGRLRGLEVFLSAVLACRLVQKHLSLKHVAQLSAIMEATISLRDDHSLPLDKLYDSLLACNQLYGLGMSENELVETVQQGVDLRNRLSGNMITDDVADFLNHTWRLLPEESPALRKANMHTLVDYYELIRSMVELVDEIDPDSVFGSFRGLPSDRDLACFRASLSRNLSQAKVYLHVRLLTIAIVGGFACLTGGDAPMTFFFGDLPSLQYKSERLGDGFPLAPSPNEEASASSSYSAELHGILCGEHMEEPGSDARNAPLAAYVYRSIGDSGVQYALPFCVPEVMTDKADAWSLLLALPAPVVVAAGEELEKIAISRQQGIRSVCLELQTKARNNSLRFV